MQPKGDRMKIVPRALLCFCSAGFACALNSDMRRANEYTEQAAHVYQAKGDFRRFPAAEAAEALLISSCANGAYGGRGEISAASQKHGQPHPC